MKSMRSLHNWTVSFLNILIVKSESRQKTSNGGQAVLIQRNFLVYAQVGQWTLEMPG